MPHATRHPGAALQELWQLIAIAENALLAVSIMVIITGLIGMVTVIIATLNERRREIAIFRALGARRETLLGLLMIESGFYGVAAIACPNVLRVGLPVRE